MRSLKSVTEASPLVRTAMLGFLIMAIGATIGIVTAIRVWVTSIDAFDPAIEHGLQEMLVLGACGFVTISVARLIALNRADR